MKRYRFSIVAIAIAIALTVAIFQVPNRANAQAITSVSCANIPIDVGNALWPGDTINFRGAFFEAENDIQVQEIRLPMFRQTGGLANNSSRWTLYEVTGVPTSLGANQPTFSATASAIPLWSSGEVTKADLPNYTAFTDETRGDPDNWHSVAVSPNVNLEAGKFYAVGAWAWVNGTTSFAQQVAYGQNSTGDCGINNAYISASGQVYNAADDILSVDIVAGGAGCFFSAFAFPCGTVSGGNVSGGFAIYGIEVIPAVEPGTIDSWLNNFLASMGMNGPFGRVLVGSLFAMIMFAVLAMKGVPWIISLGLTGVAVTFLTAALIFDPAILLGLIAIIMLGGMGLLFALVLGGDKD